MSLRRRPSWKQKQEIRNARNNDRNSRLKNINRAGSADVSVRKTNGISGKRKNLAMPGVQSYSLRSADLCDPEMQAPPDVAQKDKVLAMPYLQSHRGNKADRETKAKIH